MSKLTGRILRLLGKSPISFNELKGILGVHQQTLANKIHQMKENRIQLEPLVDMRRQRVQMVYDLKSPLKLGIGRKSQEIVDQKLSAVNLSEPIKSLLVVWQSLGTVSLRLQGSYLHAEGYRRNSVAPGSMRLVATSYR